MSADVKLTSDAMKARDVNVLKGPKRQYTNNQEKTMTKDTFKQFVNKDGYAKGGVPVEESPLTCTQIQDLRQVLEEETTLPKVIALMLKELKLLEKKRNL